MRYVALAIALLFAFEAPVASLARGGGGGGARAGGGGGARAGGGGGERAGGGGGQRAGGGGFDLNRDARPQRPAQQPQRQGNAAAARPNNGNGGAARPNNGNGNKGNGNKGNGNKGNGNKGNGNKGNGNNGNGNRGNGNGNANKGNGNNGNGNKGNGNKGNGNSVNTGNRTNVNVSGNTVNRTVISNPVYVNNTAWGWNHGVAWAPAPAYWGGGFWGAMAIGVTSAAVFGAVVNSGTTYNSYQVQPNSPGATFLSNYQLTQTQCGPPNLVVVYGPSNSVICANPNNLVSAGQYNLDTTTLSITSAG
jgi:hypothetical protein